MTSLCTHCPVSGYGSGAKHAATPRSQPPRSATILGGERADRADRDPHPLRVDRMGDDRVADEATGARLPARTAWVVAQARDVRPGLPAVVAPEEAGGLGARPDRPVGAGDVPDRRDLRTVVAVGQPFRRMGPGRAQVLASEDGRPVPGDPPAARIAPSARSTVRSWIGQPLQSGPRRDHERPGRIAVEDEGAL